MRILIADDNKQIRFFLSHVLGQLGYEVILAEDGQKAWEILQKEEIYLIITDWMMPNMDGIELCKTIRSANLSRYVYIIILTSKNNKDEVIEGMKAGADDFVIKPFTQEELDARIRAGQRIVELEKALAEKNKKLSEAYRVIKKDLEAGAQIQLSLLPKKATKIVDIEFDWLFLPSAFLAGDILNYFRLDENHVGFYLLDVAGHGIPAALLSITLSKVLLPSNIQDNIFKTSIDKPPYYKIRSPEGVVSDLNQRFPPDNDVMQYFTMIFGIIDIKSGLTKMVQAGHPNPIFLKSGKEPELVGRGGFPVGMLPEADWEEYEVVLDKGDTLLIYSDGITECFNPQKEAFSTERLMKLIDNAGEDTFENLIDRIKKNLYEWKQGDQFEDDVTLLSIKRM